MNESAMKLKGMFCASVCVVLLAASAAAPSLAGATEIPEDVNAATLVKALAALEGGRLAQAVELYSRLINTRKLSPELLARALLNRGLAHQRLGHHAAAITDYDAALRIDALTTRARVKALYNRALAFRALGDAGRAIEDLTAALYLDPAFAPAYFARGNILHERGLYYLALADYDQALAHGHPEKYRVHYARALLFSALNSLARTKEALYAALKEKPDFAPARKRLSAILNGEIPKTRLFADLAQAPKKRIVARIGGAAEGVMTTPRTASVMIAGAPVLNLMKPPQAEPVPPPGADDVARATSVAAAAAPGATPKEAPRQQAWRVASTQPVAPAGARQRAKAGETAEAVSITSMGTKASMAPMQTAAPASSSASAKGATSTLRTASIAPATAAATEQAQATQPAPDGWAIQLAAQRTAEAQSAAAGARRQARHHPGRGARKGRVLPHPAGGLCRPQERTAPLPPAEAQPHLVPGDARQWLNEHIPMTETIGGRAACRARPSPFFRPAQWWAGAGALVIPPRSC